MRKKQLGHLLSGSLLALIFITPIHAAAISEPLGPAAQPSSAAPAPAAPGDASIKNEIDEHPAAIDVQIADKLRAIMTSGPLDKRIERAPEREATAAFYAARNYAPLWIADGQPDSRAKSVIAQLENAAADGLDAADYRIPTFGTSAEALADADITLTNSVLTYARHLATGRIAPGRVVSEVDYGDHTPPPADILRKLAEATDAGAALESFNPPHSGFRALKAKLAELRSRTFQPALVGDDAPVRPVRRGARVRKISAAVASRSKPDQAIDRVIANMERWRWLPRDLGHTYVMVNIPDYSLKVVHDHQVQWRTKIVAGKPKTPTPLLTASMDTVLLNPSWHVPQSIIRKELLPRYGSDPTIFARMGLKVKRERDGTLSVTQPPGARNALGRIKFNFTNEFSVYLHDTPEKRLFAADKRAFSHGCMRVENPTEFGEIILHLAMNGPTPNAQQLSAMFGRGERSFRLTDRPMVHLTYQTAFVDDAGKLQQREDVYGMDERIENILDKDARRVADAAAQQDPKRERASTQANQAVLRRVERGEAANASEFFDHMPRGQARRAPTRLKPAVAGPGVLAETHDSPPPRPFLAIFGR